MTVAPSATSEIVGLNPVTISVTTAIRIANMNIIIIFPIHLSPEYIKRKIFFILCQR